MSIAPKSRPTSHYRKTQAGHHRHSKRYLKTYWPYLPMVGIIAGGVLVNSLLVSQDAVLGVQNNFSSSSLLSITNSDRSKDNEAPLSISSDLSSAAQAKANDMVKQDYWSHTSPSGETAEDFIINSGYQFAVAGENLAYGFSSSSAVMSAWMNSPDHRANILDSSYKDVGFGVAESPNYLGKGAKVIVVAEYAEPTGASGVLGVVNQPPMQSVSRLQTLTGSNATWLELSLTALLSASVVYILLRHGLLFRKWAKESESFVIKHPMLDILIVFLATAGAILSRGTGIIG